MPTLPPTSMTLKSQCNCSSKCPKIPLCLYVFLPPERKCFRPCPDQCQRCPRRDITERSFQFSMGDPTPRREITQRSQRDHREINPVFSRESDGLRRDHGEITERPQRDHREIIPVFYGESDGPRRDHAEITERSRRDHREITAALYGEYAL